MKPHSLLLTTIITSMAVIGCSGTTTNEEQVPEEPVAIELPTQIEDSLSTFLHLVNVNQIDKAYNNKTTEIFRNSMSRDQFGALVQVGRLRDISAMQYTAYEETSKKEAQAQIAVAFWDKEQRNISFKVKRESGSWLVDGITLSLSEEILASTFPSQEELLKVIKVDIRAFEKALEDTEAREHFYGLMSKNGRESVSWEDFEKVLDAFVAKPEVDVHFEDDDAFTLDEGSPTFKGTRAAVSGTYKEEEQKVQFSITYDFEWAWKIASFTIAKYQETTVE